MHKPDRMKQCRLKQKVSHRGALQLWFSSLLGGPRKNLQRCEAFFRIHAVMKRSRRVGCYASWPSRRGPISQSVHVTSPQLRSVRETVILSGMQVVRKPAPLEGVVLECVRHREGLVVRELGCADRGDDRLRIALEQVGWHIVLHSVLSCGLRPSNHHLHRGYAINPSACACCLVGSLQGWELRI